MVDADSLRNLHAKYLDHTNKRIEVLQKLECPVNDFGWAKCKLDAKLQLKKLLEGKYLNCLNELDNVEINRFEHCSAGLTEELLAYKEQLIKIQEAKKKFESEYNFKLKSLKQSKLLFYLAITISSDLKSLASDGFALTKF